MKAPPQTKAKTSSSAPPTFIPVRSRLLQRKCACGGTPGPSGECESCRKKKLQRRSENLDLSSVLHPPSSVSEVPPIVHEVLRSAGEPLDKDTRAFMEPRFGHDFSQVRIHTDANAAESARAVHALAYTVDNHIALGKDQHAPGTTAGRLLLAHELAHVIQQSAGGVGSDSEARANLAAESIMKGRPMTSGMIGTTSIGLHRQHDKGQGANEGAWPDLDELKRQLLAMPSVKPGINLNLPQGKADKEPGIGVTMGDWRVFIGPSKKGDPKIPGDSIEDFKMEEIDAMPKTLKDRLLNLISKGEFTISKKLGGK
jgi:Domain of unknown function (DUF4157)